MKLNKAAQELGRMAKGVSKTLTKEERERRSNWMKSLNKKRRKTNDSQNSKTESE